MAIAAGVAASRAPAVLVKKSDSDAPPTISSNHDDATAASTASPAWAARSELDEEHPPLNAASSGLDWVVVVVGKRYDKLMRPPAPARLHAARRREGRSVRRRSTDVRRLARRVRRPPSPVVT